MELDKLGEKFRLANTKFLQLKNNLDSQKALYYQQISEKHCLGIYSIRREVSHVQISYFLESKAGMLTNIPMLRDFKQTEEEVENHARFNKKMTFKLRNWWEG